MDLTTSLANVSKAYEFLFKSMPDNLAYKKAMVIVAKSGNREAVKIMFPHLSKLEIEKVIKLAEEV